MEQPTFEKKKINLELKFADVAPETWATLKSLPRTGWVRRGVEDPESVQDHIIALRELAAEILVSTDEFSETEIQEILNMLEVHDWPEAIVGDQVIVTYDEAEKKKLKDQKFKEEQAAMVKICEKLGSIGEAIMNLWMRFEKGEDPSARFANEIDKYQAIEKAFWYEVSEKNVSTQEFIDYNGRRLTHPLILERLERIRESLNSRLKTN